jgi:hypothetical protein
MIPNVKTMRRINWPSALSIILLIATGALAILGLEVTTAGSTLSRGITTQSAQPSAGTQLTYTLYLPVVAHQLPQDTIAGVEMASISTSGGLNRMAQAGATWVRRAAVWWPDVESSEGVYTWSALSYMETEFTNAAAQGMQVILVVRGAPSWAQKYVPWACGPIAQAKLGAFGDFMAALVSRYSQPPYNVKHYEIGNEEDVDRALLATSYNSTFGCWGDNTDAYYGGGYYAEMLKVIYPRIKLVDSTAQVIIGGLLLDCDPGPPVNSCASVGNNSKPSKFLEGILKNSGGPYFDGIAFHAYDWYTGVLGGYYNPNFHSNSETTGPVVIAKAEFLKSVLSAYGVAGKYLMNTESALLTGSDVNDPDYEKTKAYYVAQLYSAAHAIDLRSNIWYSVFGWPGRGTALLNTDLTSRPAYTAFQTVTAVLGGADYMGTVASADVGGSTNVRGYKFKRSGQNIWVVWSADAKPHTLYLSQPPASVVDAFGNTVYLTNTTSVTLIAPDRLQYYLEWPR